MEGNDSDRQSATISRAKHARLNARQKTVQKLSGGAQEGPWGQFGHIRGVYKSASLEREVRTQQQNTNDLKWYAD